MRWAVLAVTLAACAGDSLTEGPAWTVTSGVVAQPEPRVRRELEARGGSMLRSGSLVVVHMVATEPNGAVEQADAVVFWPWGQLSDRRSASSRCWACLEPMKSRSGTFVAFAGTLGVPDDWLAGVHVGDVMRFDGPPGRWASVNGPEQSFHSPRAKVEWTFSFACPADLRQVVFSHRGLKNGTPFNLPDGRRLARWYEFHGCSDGQTPPYGFAGLATQAAIHVERE